MGRLYWLKVYELPEGNKQSKGRAIQNMINLQTGDKVRTCINVKGLTDQEYIENHYLIFITKNGLMKKTTLEAYSRPRANGIIALGLREGDELIGVTLTDGQSEMLVASYNGKVCRFNESGVRPMGRSATGVKAITLEEDGKDRVIGTVCVEKNTDKTILVISENGFGKRTALDDEEGNAIYRVTNRGGKGVKTIEITEKTGQLIGIHAVTDSDDLMLITKAGTAIRMDISTIRQTGRAAQGVKLIELQKRNDTLMSGCIVPKEEEEGVNELTNEGVSNRDRLHDYLEAHGVGTVIHYPIAPHKQECYAKEVWNIPQLSLPITEELADTELSLPISPCLTKEQVEWVVKCINEFK